MAIYMTAGTTEHVAPRRTPRNLGDIMSWNMFSRFGAGSDPDVVSFGDLEEAVGSNAWTVVDVREPHEFASGHIPNAVNMPMSSFDPEALLEGKPVVLICQSGGRSRNALSKARAIGREDVRHFAGGMNGWRSHNGPVTL
jgi:rhodanese-related sulfurtransferase